LLCLLIVKNVGIHTILVNDNAELVTEKTSLSPSSATDRQFI
jgi:hypothetical protein